MAKRDKRHLYFRDRKAWREWKASLPPLTLDLVTKEAINLFHKTQEKVNELYAAGVEDVVDGTVDWRTDNLDTLMEAAMAGDSLPTRTAQSLLLEAAEIVSGDRERTHGKKERSFEVIADFWDTYLTGRVDRATGRVTALDVAQMMVLLKIARTIQGEPVWDHFLDAAGYSGVAGEIYASMKGTSHGPK